MTVYTIEYRFYDNYRIEVYKTWEKVLEGADYRQYKGGSGCAEKFTIGTYEAPDNDNTVNHWEGIVWHPAARDRYARVDSIPEEWKEIETQEISYSAYPTEVWAEKNPEGELTYLTSRDDDKPEAENGGKVVEAWMDDGGFIFASEEEAYEDNKVSNYI
jgi:hypothetical protein